MAKGKLVNEYNKWDGGNKTTYISDHNVNELNSPVKGNPKLLEKTQFYSVYESHT